MFQVSTGPIALTASTTKTVLDLQTFAGVVARPSKWWAESDATSAGTATSAIRVQVGLFTAAVTTHTAVTPDTFDGADGNNAAFANAGINTTSEGAGTPSGTHYEEHILPLTQSSLIIWEPKVRLIPASSFWRIRLIIPANIGTTNGYFGVAWDE